MGAFGFLTSSKQKDSLTKFYNLEKKPLGSGNFAKVYKATRTSPRKISHGGGTEVEVPTNVAVKVIDKAKVEDMNDITREIEIMESIAHPNVIQLYEIFDTPKHMNLVMELVTGGELFDEIVNRGQYTEKDAAFVMGSLCGALAYLHERKIVHRDLKPENILLACKPKPGEEPAIKVADFGLARLVSEKDMMKTACGTPGYVAPEVLKNKGYDSGAVDLWSAGVILYILLCGFPPFYEEELPALFDQILKAKYDFPSPWWDQISADAKGLVKGLLTIDPKARLDATAVLQTKWICGNAPSTAISIDQLRKFQASRKMKAAAQRIIALQRAGIIGKSDAAKKAQAENGGLKPNPTS